MSFASRAKGREVSCITRLLEIFGVVAQGEMRRLFSDLSSAAYGRILSRLHREGHVYWAKDGIRLAASRLTMDRTDFAASALCFRVFTEIRDAVIEYCAGEPPSVVTVVTKKKVIDLIPVTAGNVEAVNAHAKDLPEQTRRFLITRDRDLLALVERRTKNDYAILVDGGGNVETYEL